MTKKWGLKRRNNNVYFITSIKGKESQKIKLLSWLSFSQVFKHFKALSNPSIYIFFHQVLKDQPLSSMCTNTNLKDQRLKESKTRVPSASKTTDLVQCPKIQWNRKHFLESQVFFSADTADVISLLC